jgi:hypothetical protein
MGALVVKHASTLPGRLTLNTPTLDRHFHRRYFRLTEEVPAALRSTEKSVPVLISSFQNRPKKVSCLANLIRGYGRPVLWKPTPVYVHINDDVSRLAEPIGGITLLIADFDPELAAAGLIKINARSDAFHGR